MKVHSTAHGRIEFQVTTHEARRLMLVCQEFCDRTSSESRCSMERQIATALVNELRTAVERPSTIDPKAAVAL